MTVLVSPTLLRYMYDPDKFKAARTKPLQARGKERVRVILSAALELFKESGVEEVTTNDIAQRAKIPIGSLYRYYPNKDAIIVALTELYVYDVCDIFDNIAQHPLLQYLSWDEILLLMVDAWANYTTLNGPFTFLYAEKASPRLYELTRPAWTDFVARFEAVLKKRCPEVSDRELLIAFQLSLAAIEIGTNKMYVKIAGPYPHHDAVGAIASYMLQVCNRHSHGMD
jgi:AcrR family transcriptional regulator